MTVSKIRLPDNTEHDIRAKYLIQSSSSDAISAEFSARTTTEDAVANIQKIYGNTVKWNQLVQNGNFASTANWTATGVTLTTSNNVGTVTLTNLYGVIKQAAPLIAGHKYYLALTYKTSITTFIFGIGQYNASSARKAFSTSNSGGNWYTATVIIDNTSNLTGDKEIFIGNRDVSSGSVELKNFMVIDLTAIYGSGNEPSVSEFEAQYPADYYPYDPGAFTSNSATAILSTGRNLFDEDAVFGSAQNISKVASGWSGAAGHFAAIGHIWENIFVYGGQICIYMKATADSSGGGFRPVFHYSDNTSSNGPVVGTSVDTYVVSSSGKVVSYIDLTYSSGRTIVIEKLCISYSDPTYDGTYEHYTEFHQIDLNIPTLTGKLNGAGSSAVIFPNGMGKVNTIVDELIANKATKRTATVDLGTLTWTWNSAYSVFTAPLPTAKGVSNNSVSANIACASYNAGKANNAYNHAVDMSVGITDGTTKVVIYNSTKTSSDITGGHASWLDGVDLLYELVTPQEYILDNALQLQYPVVAGGTEMVLPTTGTAPMKMDVIYGNAADAAATMSQNYISVDSMKEFLAALGTQMGGTWSMGYENGKHTFTFTSN